MKSIYFFIAFVAIISISSTGCKKQDDGIVWQSSKDTKGYGGYKGTPGQINECGGEWRFFTIHPDQGGWYYKYPATKEPTKVSKTFLVYIDSVNNAGNHFFVSMENNSPAFDPFKGYRIDDVNVLDNDTLLKNYLLVELKAKRRVMVSVYKLDDSYHDYMSGYHTYFIVKW